MEKEKVDTVKGGSCFSLFFNVETDSLKFGSVEVCDSPDGADFGADSSPVTVAAVLSRAQVVHSAFVVGMLVEEPMAVHHTAGVEVRHAELVLSVGTVLLQLVHLARHVEALVQSDLVQAFVLPPEKTLLLSGVILLNTLKQGNTENYYPSSTLISTAGLNDVPVESCDTT